MSISSATGGGGSVTPGWYTDPHDPRQLRWWSGEGWTEHVSAGSGQPEAATAAQAAPLPSRRALRDPAAEASDATAAAESALAAQAAQQQAQQQAQFAQQQAADYAANQAQAQQQAAQQGGYGSPSVAPVAPAQPQYAAPAAPLPSAPVPTLPVAPTSFLEQQGYAPLGSAATPATPAAPTQPEAVPVGQVFQPAQPVQPVQPNAWNQPVQPEQPGWGAPPAAAPSVASDGLDSLFGGPATAQGASTDQQLNQWGLSPRDANAASREPSEGVAGSSTFWGWLVAISPILAAGSVVYVLLTTKSALTDWPFEAAVAAPYLLVLLFALADRSVLSQLGHSRPASAGWALLSAPIYLVVRSRETRREDGSGTAVVLVWFLSVLVAAGGIVGYGVLTHHALFAGLPT